MHNTISRGKVALFERRRALDPPGAPELQPHDDEDGHTSIFGRARPTYMLEARITTVPIDLRRTIWSHQMFTPRRYRARAEEYSELIKGTDKPDEIREFQRLKHKFTELADNGDWMANNSNKTRLVVHSL